MFYCNLIKYYFAFKTRLKISDQKLPNFAECIAGKGKFCGRVAAANRKKLRGQVLPPNFLTKLSLNQKNAIFYTHCINKLYDSKKKKGLKMGICTSVVIATVVSIRDVVKTIKVGSTWLHSFENNNNNFKFLMLHEKGKSWNILKQFFPHLTNFADFVR